MRSLMAIGICAWCLTGCFQWKPIAPPTAPAPAVSRAPDLPRWVRVTTRGSAQYLLEDAEFRGDTLVGQGSGDKAAPLVRLPVADIAHMEARRPSPTGAAWVAGGVVAFLWFVGHAAEL